MFELVNFEDYKRAVIALNQFSSLYGADDDDTRVICDYQSYCERNGLDASLEAAAEQSDDGDVAIAEDTYIVKLNSTWAERENDDYFYQKFLTNDLDELKSVITEKCANSLRFQDESMFIELLDIDEVSVSENGYILFKATLLVCDDVYQKISESTAITPEENHSDISFIIESYSKINKFKDDGALMLVECIGETCVTVTGSLTEQEIKNQIMQLIIDSVSIEKNNASIYASDSSESMIDYLSEQYDVVFHGLDITSFVVTSSTLRTALPVNLFNLLFERKKVMASYEHHYAVKYKIKGSIYYSEIDNIDVIGESTKILDKFNLGIDSSSIGF